ncbi:MAG: dicarboxylate/amino acid:cation symporter [Candidatus Calescibacterium sp.]|nr:dicarboxylate/amino acid:cation symporter [Candidatus Calescibacterium sp.]MCX7972443.1 dicarboxylate/amino acid:cation symporter [bacterium]MDW8195666.1 dicarboxylate/amino acid:cation symporter [Candidatus Calescibacterium sp.]
MSKSLFKNDVLTIFLSVILGVIFGYFLPDFSKSLKIIGEIFLSLLRMLVIPLVLVAITGAIINLGSIDKLKTIGSWAIGLYFFTMFVAIFIGICSIIIINPTWHGNIENKNLNIQVKTFSEFILSIFPSNIFRSMYEGNILQLIFFCVLLGIAILSVNKMIDEVKAFFMYMFDVIMLMVKWFIKFAPVGIFSLISNIVANFGLDVFLSLSGYFLSVVAGIFFHGLVFLPVLIYLLTGSNPWIVLKKVYNALIVAFSTCSSSATLPVSMNNCIENLGLRREVVDFVLPLGATVNMNGTALYEAVAAIFVASVFGIELGFYEYIVISITSVFAAVGAAAIPGAGLITMSIVFTAVGIPLEGIGLIVIVDRFLDMFRTTLNVWGDIVVAFIIDKKTT